jgi:hypothetical protein
MRILTALIVVGPLALIGALPAAAGQSSPADTSVQLATGSDAPADRDTYLRKARDDMQEWQQKLHDFGEKAEAEGKEAGTALGNDLSQAWTKTEAASRDLQAAGAEGWQAAKTSYEKASRELSGAWHKFRPQDK